MLRKVLSRLTKTKKTKTSVSYRIHVSSPIKKLGSYGVVGVIINSEDEISQVCREIRVQSQS